MDDNSKYKIIDPFSHPDDKKGILEINESFSTTTWANLDRQEREVYVLKEFLKFLRYYSSQYGHMPEYQKVLKTVEKDEEAESVLLSAER